MTIFTTSAVTAADTVNSIPGRSRVNTITFVAYTVRSYEPGSTVGCMLFDISACIGGVGRINCSPDANCLRSAKHSVSAR